PGVPVVLPRLSAVGAGDVLAAVCRFRACPDELAAGSAVRGEFVGRIQRCIDAGLLTGDATDMAHVLLALAQGLAVQEAGRWLGSGLLIERRWKLGVTSLLAGLR